MHQQSTNTGIPKRRLYLSILTAACVGCLILGGYFWLMNTRPSQSHPKPSQLHPSATPVPSASAPEESVYMARNNHVVKLDGRTGAIIWLQTLKPPGVNSPQTCLQISDGVIYAILDYDSYAFQTSDGKQLWHISMPASQSKNLSCQVVGNRIYVLHRDGTFSALDTKNGGELWRSAVIYTDGVPFQVLHGAIYPEQNFGITALDATTGKERWHVDLQEVNVYTATPTLVAESIVYHATSNTIYALDEATGHILWQQHSDDQLALATVAHGILYAEALVSDTLLGGECNGSHPAPVCLASSYHVYAFDARKGTLRWKSAPGLSLYKSSSLFSNDTSQPGQLNLPVVNDTILAYPARSKTFTLYALDASNGNPRWQSNLTCAGYCDSLPALFDGKTLSLSDYHGQGNSMHILTLDLSNGQQISQQTLPLQNQGRSVELVGIDHGRVYVLEKGNEYTLDVIHGLNLANGADLWHYQVDNYASGSIETPIMAS